MEKLTITQRLHAIMSEADYIQKDKTNAFHKYNYASEQAIKEKIQPLLVKYGVLFSVSVLEILPSPVASVTNIKLSYRFSNVDDKDSYLEGWFIGSGQDSGDKGVYKAVTGAIKYIMTSTFLIPTGEDPENDVAPGKTVYVESVPKAPIRVPGYGDAPVVTDKELEAAGLGEPKPQAGPTCFECSASITTAEKEYSIKLYDKPLCRGHQAKATRKTTPKNAAQIGTK